MKLSQQVLTAINKVPIRMKIALALGLSEQTIIRMIKIESDDLTKAAALKVIKEETGLTDDEILVIETANA